MEVAADREVTMEYELRVEGEEQVIDSSEPESPLRYVHGQGNLIPGLEKRMEGMNEGDERTLVVPAEEAYGEPDPQNILDIPKKELPGDMPHQAGINLQMRGPEGQTYVGVVTQIKDESVMVDFNHPLAGKTLQFSIKVLNVAQAQAS